MVLLSGAIHEMPSQDPSNQSGVSLPALIGVIYMRLQLHCKEFPATYQKVGKYLAKVASTN